MLDRGGFGFGAFDQLDREKILLNGTVYHIPGNGVADEADGDVTTSFAVITSWDAESEHEFLVPMSYADVQAAIDRLNDTGRPYALKIEGESSTLLTRSEERQERPYAPPDEPSKVVRLSHQR